MAEKEWTSAQLAAIGSRGSNLLVAAGAGSGKTAVLIQRILTRILAENNPVDVDQLLVLTYTNAAAAEMRQRLSAAIYEALAERPNQPHLERQLILLQRAQITTLHAFCLDTIKKYFYLLDLDPKARIGNPGELLLLQDQTLEQIFESYYQMEDSPLILLLQHYNRGIDDDSIRKLVLQLAEYSNSMADPAGWLDGLLLPYLQGNIDHWLLYLCQSLQEQLAGLAETAAKLVQICQEEANGLGKYLPVLQTEAAALTAAAKRPLEAISPAIWEDWRQRINAISFQRLPAITKKMVYSEDAKAVVANDRDQIKKAIKKIQELYCQKSYGEIQREIQQLRPLVEALLTMTKAYLTAWQQKKQQKKLLEFSDLEHLCLQLLQAEGNGVAAEMRQQFVEVLVDEYQDINQVQEAILSAVSQEENRFMVGDMKQSIYRFRMAEPTLFLRKFADYGAGQGGKRIDLKRNFRSQHNLIACVNDIFAQLMGGGELEITYDEAAALEAGNKKLPAVPVELCVLDEGAETAETIENAVDPDEESTETAESLLTVEKEAVVLAEKIQRLHQAGRRYDEMVILLRSLKNWAGPIKEVLERYGIPCLAEQAGSFYESPEIETIISLLQVLDNPRQDIPLAAVLHSPIVGLSLRDLAAVRVVDQEHCLWQAVQQSQDQRLQEFCHRLTGWRKLQRLGKVSLLLQEIYRQTNLLTVFGSMTGGVVRRQNLLTLLQMAKDFDANHEKGLYRFLVLLERNQAQEQTGGYQENRGGVVTVMSIHRSKGLEFPIVFLLGLGKKWNESDTKQDILVHREMGLGLRMVDLKRQMKYPTLSYRVLAQKVTWEMRAEELRILYVAMTRAEERLYCIGTSRNLVKQLEQYHALLSNESRAFSAYEMAGCHTDLAWLLLVLLRHPDGAPLRQLADFPAPTLTWPETIGRWQVEVVAAASLQLPDGEISAKEEQWLQHQLTAGSVSETVQEALVWQYPRQGLSQFPIKWSATAVQQWQQEQQEEQRILPVQLSETVMQPFPLEPLPEVQEEAPSLTKLPKETDDYAKLGTLIHQLLEQADLEKMAAGYPAAEVLAEGLAALPAAEEWRQAVNVAQVALFYETEVGKALLMAVRRQQTVLRECNFTLSLPIAMLGTFFLGKEPEEMTEIAPLLETWQLLPEQWNTEQIFLQGAIDLAFHTEAGWVLVDYKSGWNAGLSDTALLQKYGRQLQIYRYAIQQTLQEEVQAAYLYFTQNQRIVQVF